MTRFIAVATGLLLSVSAEAGLIVTNIEMEVRRSNYVVQGTESATELLAQFRTGSEVCTQSLTQVANAGSRQVCGGPLRNIATMFTITFDQDPGTSLWQLGADWGRGGSVLTPDGGANNFTGDYWWAFNWGRTSEIIDFTYDNSGELDPTRTTVSFLGFEGCCGGGMSLRHSTDGGATWTAATAVPAPATLMLLGLGLAGVAWRRRDPR